MVSCMGVSLAEGGAAPARRVFVPAACGSACGIRVTHTEARRQVERGINQGRYKAPLSFASSFSIVGYVILSVISPHIKHANSLAIAVAATFLFVWFFNVIR